MFVELGLDILFEVEGNCFVVRVEKNIARLIIKINMLNKATIRNIFFLGKRLIFIDRDGVAKF